MNNLENRIDYHFNNRDLLVTAMTHSSYAKEHSLAYHLNNERLEFIGDAYIDAVIGQELFSIMDRESEGTLSKRRSAIVCAESLADVARQIGIGDCIRLGKGERACKGADKDSILSDAFEALMGAIIMDSSFEVGRGVILKLLGEKVDLAVRGLLYVDYKSDLQEILQARYKNLVRIVYSVVREDGPAHDKIFAVEVSAGEKVLGAGEGKSKLKAEQAAAKDAIMKGDFSVL